MSDGHAADPVTVSVVTPVYRGRDHLDDLAARVGQVRAHLEEHGAPVRILELVLVDDGSTDGSEEVLRRLDAAHDWVTVVTLSRNFGQHPATVAGILHSGGEWVATIDEDLQHPPELIVDELLRRAVVDGKDLVYGRASGRVHSTGRDLASRAFKRLLVLGSGNRDLALASSFRIVRGDVARGAAAAGDHETYLDVSLSWFTDRITAVELELTDDRFQGQGSGYRLGTLLAHARRAAISSQAKIIRLAALLGFLAIAVAGSLLVSTALVVQGEGVEGVPGWASLFTAVLFFGGVLCVMLVVLLEYAVSTALHLKGKPTFFPVDRSRDALLRAWFAA